MRRNHIEPDGHFYLNGVGQMSDAHSLLTALVNAKRLLAVMDDKEIALRAILASDKSKFAGDL